ncbi:hypothetical protein [Gallaecimonas pentaromativorans]|uniref:Uncharacterized protein n=1 Tax=Gallaecimonas pentaromativorans TaxID=584787 RepID=A0A3N1P4G7_9GAMM|nr:hypothetical protein [Gallaecimonas pentaromativorans]ROQ22047.1 hypothetical protein EDC28_111149 [Gallaecimonas pentaromativorans]
MRQKALPLGLRSLARRALGLMAARRLDEVAKADWQQSYQRLDAHQQQQLALWLQIEVAQRPLAVGNSLWLALLVAMVLSGIAIGYLRHQGLTLAAELATLPAVVLAALLAYLPWRQKKRRLAHLAALLAAQPPL